MILPPAFVARDLADPRLAPESAGSGIPQVIAAAERPAPVGADDPRLSWRTAAFKALLCAALLACGASIGREGPTVQIAAAAVTLGAGLLRRGPSRRAIIIAGGAAGVAAAFNTPIAGVVFGVEELAKSFDRRTHTVVILVVVVAGLTSFALQETTPTSGRTPRRPRLCRPGCGAGHRRGLRGGGRPVLALLLTAIGPGTAESAPDAGRGP